MVTPCNLERYHNGDEGVFKEIHCREVCQLILDAECTKSRTTKDVCNRIYFYTESFKSTYEWAYESTDQEILQSESLISYRDKVENSLNFTLI